MMVMGSARGVERKPSPVWVAVTARKTAAMLNPSGARWDPTEITMPTSIMATKKMRYRKRVKSAAATAAIGMAKESTIATAFWV